MKQEKTLNLNKGEISFLRAIFYCTKFGFDNAKFEYSEYITSPLFASILSKADEYVLSTLTHEVDIDSMYKNNEKIQEIIPFIQNILGGYSHWSDLSIEDQHKMVKDLFIPFQPDETVIEHIVNSKSVENKIEK